MEISMLDTALPPQHRTGRWAPNVSATVLLTIGGSRPAMEAFKAFRGREPSIDALLRHSGLTELAA